MKNKGFTLIELLVVIALIGVLAGVILVVIDPLTQFAKARNAQRKSDLRQIADALERYLATRGSYPTTTSNWCGLPADYSTCGADWIPGLVASGEIKKLPQDPRTAVKNPNSVNPGCDNANITGYLYKSNGTDYKLLAYCTPEGKDGIPATDPFHDPTRVVNGKSHTYQISSSDAIKNNAGW